MTVKKLILQDVNVSGSWPNLSYFTRISLEGLNKTMKTLLRIVSVPAEIQTGHLLNTRYVGTNSCEYWDHSVFGCDIWNLADKVLIFWRNLLYSSSELEHRDFCEMLVPIYQSTRLHIQGDSTHNVRGYITWSYSHVCIAGLVCIL